mmetsp:Transcript_16722/g.23066  ORF Transcript_16722/g.23066 Transcript_16722/m.23066 type:complete len:108 (+) Transcript_16722:54-377(+)
MIPEQDVKRSYRPIPREAWLPSPTCSRGFGGSVLRAYPSTEDIPPRTKSTVKKSIQLWKKNGMKTALKAINQRHDNLVITLGHHGNKFPFSPASFKNVSFGFSSPMK